MKHGHADPLRQPEGGRRRPHRRTRSGAFDLYGGPTIVVDFGTATTLDAVSAKGEYLGGAILPGIEISLDALFGRAAALRRVELVEPRNVIGKQHGRVDAVGRGLRLHRRRSTGCASGSAKSWATSRWSPPAGSPRLIAPLSKSIEHHEPWLTLHGLRLIYEQNREPAERRRPYRLPMAEQPRTASSRRATPPPPDGLRRRSSRARRPASRSPSPAASCCGACRASSPSPRSQDSSGRIQLFAPADTTPALRRVQRAVTSATGSASRAR